MSRVSHKRVCCSTCEEKDDCNLWKKRPYKTDVGYKLIDIYANVAHEEVSFTLKSVVVKSMAMIE
jgi:hypothetical protein